MTGCNLSKKDVRKIELLDVVALTHDIPEYNLWRGQVGTVVEILADGNAFEVEFSDRDGRTFMSLGFRAPQLMVLHHEPRQTSPTSTCKKLNSNNVLYEE